MGRTRLGLKAKAYAMIASTETELAIIKDDVSITLTKNETDVSSRGDEWDLVRGTTKVNSVDFQLLDKEDDTIAAVFMDSLLNGTPIEMWFLNFAKGTAGAEGPHAEYEVFQMNRKEARKEGIVFEIIVKPTDGPTAGLPEWFIDPSI